MSSACQLIKLSFGQMDFSLCCFFYNQNVLEAIHFLSLSLVCLSHCTTVVRKLQEFELPYVSVTSLHNPDYHIVLRKRYTRPQRLLAAHITSGLVNHFSRLLFLPCYSHKDMLSHHSLQVQLWFRKFKKTLFFFQFHIEHCGLPLYSCTQIERTE